MIAKCILFDIPLVATVMIVEGLERLKSVTSAKNERFKMGAGDVRKTRSLVKNSYTLLCISVANL